MYEDALATAVHETSRDLRVSVVAVTVGAAGVGNTALPIEIVKVLVVLVAPLASVTRTWTFEF
jgi:hypothetical protein